MNLAQLNAWAEDYKSSQGSAESFRLLYDETCKMFRHSNRTRIKATGLGDETDADEILDGVILEALRVVTVDYSVALIVKLKQAQLNYMKKEIRRRQRYELTTDFEGGHHDLAEDDSSAEVIVLKRQRKKEADQRQLIDFLVNDPSQVDHDTTLIVSQFSQYDSIAALAKALGMHHETVKRKLRRLSRRYDANRFGDIREYLAV